MFLAAASYFRFSRQVSGHEFHSCRQSRQRRRSLTTQFHGPSNSNGCPYSANRSKLSRMKRTFVLAIALLLCLSTGFAQDWAKQKLDKSTRHGEWVDIKHDARTVRAFVVYPEVKSKAPVVI